MTFRVDTSQLAAISAKLRHYSKVIKEEVAIEGAAAMAKVIYDEARIFAPVSEKAHVFYGRSSVRTGVKYTFQPGTLKAAIYRVYSKDRSDLNRKTYHVGWNHQKAPYGFMVEFGTSHAAANPFMRPSLARVPQAIQAAKGRMAVKLKEITGGI
ncbi:hypothetical protein GTP46_24430 [Duganella sp. FT135W]|uniref:HK97 gp10 family phage protein n=1 Tax=Duganella flavida TaxID=2692175 RepID=A0A6L8KE92_9BURK|nr:HK97-gp10 family putative phage morphogenesis protein [Duganella flavida]MYM25779.1 hypothetical protein [Duganella flavida]